MASKVVAILILLIFGSSSLAALVRRNAGTEVKSIRIMGKPPEPSLMTKEPSDKLFQHPTFTHDKSRSKFSLVRLFRFLRKKWRSSIKRLREFIKALKNRKKNQATSPSDPPPLSETIKAINQENIKLRREKIDVIKQDSMELVRIYTSLTPRLSETKPLSDAISLYHEKLMQIAAELDLDALLPMDEEGQPYLPPETIHIITQSTAKKFVEHSKQHLSEKFFVRTLTPEVHLEFWQYIFRSWDFLIKNQLLYPSSFQGFFDDYLLGELGAYAKVYAEKNKDHLIHSGSHRLTEHWYWQLMHGSLKALSKKSQSQINNAFLSTRYQEEIFPLVKNDRTRWRSLIAIQKLARWETDFKHLDTLMELIASTDYRLLNPDQPTKEFESLRKIMVYCCDHFEYLEESLEGYLKSKINYPRPQKFDFIKISAEMDSLTRRAKSYYNQHVIKTVNWEKSSIFKSTFEDHLTKFNLLFDQIQSNRNWAYQELHHMEFNSVVQDTIKYFKGVRDNLEEKLNTFAVSKN